VYTGRPRAAVCFGKDLAHATTRLGLRGIVRLGGYDHSAGLATHDVMGSFAGPDEALRPGLVFACDIQLFRLDEQIGIRNEGTVAIIEQGHEVLSFGVPRTVADIETLMNRDGILQILARHGF